MLLGVDLRLRHAGIEPAQRIALIRVPAREFAGQAVFDRGDRRGRRGAAQVGEISAGGERQFVLAGVGRFREKVAAPRPDRIRGKFGAPPQGEAVGVLLVARLAARRRTHVVPDDAAQGDGVDAANGAGAVTQIDILAAIDVALVESTELLPERALDQNTGARDSRHGAHRVEDP